MHSNRTILAVLLLILAAALCASTSHAQTVTFTYSLSCDTNKDFNCPFSFLYVANGIGGKAGDYVTIATVNSDVPGYTNPVPINGGLLSFTSSPATRVMCDEPPGGCYAVYDNPGGSASIVGSVFGLPDGATLLTGSFQGGAGSHFNILGAEFGGPISISFINPVILDNLGLAGVPNCGTGYLSDYFADPQFNNGIEVFQVSVTFTPGINIIHNFTGGQDGGNPYTGLTMDKAGNLYGTTYYGGHDFGTVFRLKRSGSNWTLNPLYSFFGQTYGDGGLPDARVIVGPDGSLYGTTEVGGGTDCFGGVGCGTVFNLRPKPTACLTGPNSCPWTETVLYRFSGGPDGGSPDGDLLFDQAGNIYGTTQYGGANDNGVVYELTPSGGSWTESVLYSFRGGSDGGVPYAGVIFDQAGNLYGTTRAGGDLGCSFIGNYGCGTVFQLTPSGSGWAENVLYNFTGGNDGGLPNAGLISDKSGNLYGATITFGAGGGGTVFELTPSNGSWTLKTLHSFTGAPLVANGPHGTLVMDGAGNLYGTTVSGPVYYGTVFELSPSNGGWTYKDLYDFTGGSDGEFPYCNVVIDAKGNLYGTTYGGGSQGVGVVWEITFP